MKKHLADVLFCVSMTIEGEELFLCLLAISISSSMNCLFIVFAFFLNQLLGAFSILEILTWPPFFKNMYFLPICCLSLDFVFFP